MTSGFPALSAHVLVDRDVDRDLVMRRIEQLLHDRFDIHHTTLQVVECTEDLIQVEDRPRPK